VDVNQKMSQLRTIRQIADDIGWPLGSITRQVDIDKIPHVKRGNTKLYNPEHVADALLGRVGIGVFGQAVDMDSLPTCGSIASTE